MTQFLPFSTDPLKSSPFLGGIWACTLTLLNIFFFVSWRKKAKSWFSIISIWSSHDRPSKKRHCFLRENLLKPTILLGETPPPTAAFPIWVFLFFVGVFQQFRISWSRYSWAGCQEDNTAATLYMWKRSCFTTNDAPFPQFSFWSIARRRRRKKEKETKMESSKSFTIDGEGEIRHTRETWISFPSPKMDNKYPPPCTIWFFWGEAAQIFLCGFGYLLPFNWGVPSMSGRTYFKETSC